MAKRRHFLVYRPRGYDNEAYVYVGDKEFLEELAEALSAVSEETHDLPTWDFVSRAEAIRIAETLPRMYQRAGQYWDSGWAGVRRQDAPTVSERIDMCEFKSSEHLENVRMEQDALERAAEEDLKMMLADSKSYVQANG